MDRVAVKMPEAADHAPLSVLNHSGIGIRTIVVCSCGWRPAKPPEGGMRTRYNGHMAHRRSKGMPRADYQATVFGEGPWAGMTWDDWYAAHGSEGVDPYTGEERS
jgi:hypothetical protein